MNNILILMSYNREIVNNVELCDYNTLTAIINYGYSVRYNYDFKYLVPTLDNNISLYNCLSPTNELRHASWSKLLSIIKIFELKNNYDLIVYLDSDCIFHNQKISIYDYLMNSKNIKNNILNIDSDIFFMNNQPWSFELPCAGFFIIKPNENTFNFFKKWYQNNQNPHYDKIHTWEQYSLQTYLTPNNCVEIINDWMFREKENQFLRHIGSEEKNNRIPFFKKYLRENFNNNIIDNYILSIKENTIYYETSSIIL